MFDVQLSELDLLTGEALIDQQMNIEFYTCKIRETLRALSLVDLGCDV